MEPGPSDTDADTARVHTDLLRAAPPERRLRLALSLSRTVIGLSRHGLARTVPGASPEEIGLRFVARYYGPDLAEGLRAVLAARRP